MRTLRDTLVYPGGSYSPPWARIFPTTAQALLTPSFAGNADPPAGSIAYATFPPTITITPNTSADVETGEGQESYTTYAPTISVVAVQTIDGPGTAIVKKVTYYGLSAQTLSPWHPYAVFVEPAAAVEVMTGYAPTIVISSALTVSPAAASMTYTTYAPSVVGGNTITLTPGVTSMTYTTYAPTVVVNQHFNVTVPAAEEVYTTYPPEMVGHGAEVEPETAEVIYTTYLAFCENAISSPIWRSEDPLPRKDWIAQDKLI